MTVSDTPSDPDNPGLRGQARPLICIGLPPMLAPDLGGKRPVVSLLPQDIPLAGLQGVQDALIACMLLGGDADAQDVLAALADAGYRGAVIVIAPHLPDPAMVERELAQLAPGMTVTLVML